MSDDLDRSPSFDAVLDGSIRNALSRVNTSIPGRIESYDDSTRRAKVKPLIQREYFDESGDRQVESLPVIPEVPVIFPGSGGRRIKFPVKQGDTVMLLFASASLDRWLAQGGGEVDPKDNRRHSTSDAVAIVGLDASGQDGDPLIEFTEDGEIHAGGSSALATQQDLIELLTAINTATIAVGAGGAADVGVKLAALPPPRTWTTGIPPATDVLKGS